MGMSTKVVSLRLLVDERTLVYDDESRAEPTVITLSEVSRITVTSLKGFEIVTPAKSFCFEADTASNMRLWLEALKKCVDRAQGPNLKQRIERERREKVEESRRSEHLSVREELFTRNRDKWKNERSNIREKYNMQGGNR